MHPRSLTLLLLLAVAAPCAGQRAFVDATAPPGGDGLSWATAFTTLQPALAVASAGDEIWVAQGTYRGGFTIPDGVVLLGGFKSGDERRSQARPTAQQTFLDGGGTMRPVIAGDGSVIDGFVITNGRAGAPGGGGVLADGKSPVIRRCTFVNDTAFAGRGAAIAAINGAHVTVSEVLLYQNPGSAHAIDVSGGAGGTFDHLTVALNGADGLHLQDGAVCAITNCLFVQNGGRGVSETGAPPNMPTLANNLFFANGAALMSVQGADLTTIGEVNALSYAQNNIAADPLFVNPAAPDFRLRFGSPAIDAGTGVPLLPTDAYGTPRIIDGNFDGQALPDIGFAEYSNAGIAYTGTAQPGGFVNVFVDGPRSMNAALMFGSGVSSSPVLVPAIGSFALEFPIVVLPLGPPPRSFGLGIPVGLTGYGVIVQGAVFGTQVLNLSSIVDI